MGLLDEAIREHLELKRRRGADPGEVERLEREALGPVRRGPQDPADFTMDEPEAASPMAYPDEELDHEWVEPGDEEPVFDHEAEGPEADAPRHHEIAEEWDSHEPLDLEEPPEPMRASEHFDDEPLTEEHPSAAPPPAGEAPPPAPAPAQAGHPGEETVEYDVEAEQFREHDGEDVLEETPEFLQDTPDHDRLWFEQRPPKDFDFDG
jgi:hypothetical protein